MDADYTESLLSNKAPVLPWLNDNLTIALQGSLPRYWRSRNIDQSPQAADRPAPVQRSKDRRPEYLVAQLIATSFGHDLNCIRGSICSNYRDSLASQSCILSPRQTRFATPIAHEFAYCCSLERFRWTCDVLRSTRGPGTSNYRNGPRDVNVKLYHAWLSFPARQMATTNQQCDDAVPDPRVVRSLGVG